MDVTRLLLTLFIFFQIKCCTNQIVPQNLNSSKSPMIDELESGDIEPELKVKEIGYTETTKSTSTVEDEKKNPRQPVKLNAKQRLMLNQILQVYSLDDVKNNSLCKKHSQEFRVGLRAFEPWALKMFDSSSKLQAGILIGNLMEFGSFKQCINIYYDSQYGPIRGQQCTVKITPTMDVVRQILGFRNVSRKRFKKLRPILEGASLLWSVCIPDSCTSDDVLQHFDKSIREITEGLDVNVTVSDSLCYALKDEKSVSTGEWIVMLVIAFILLVVICSTAVDVYTRKEDGSANKIAQIFSAYANTEFIFSNKINQNSDLDCLNGMKFISILYVVAGHRFLMMLFFPSVNSLEVMEWLLNYSSTIILGGTVSVDTFFMVSGLLAAYHLCDFLSKGNKFNLWHYYFHRYIRVTPSLAVVVMFVAVLTHRFGSGPLWKQTSAFLEKPCQYFWWSAILHLQNYINGKYLCVVQTWYLTCDMQFYIFSPLVIYPLFKWKVFGYINYTFFYILSVAINFYIAWKHEYNANNLRTNNLVENDYFLNHYMTPYTRASTFIIGVGLGFVLFKTKGLKIKMNAATVAFGWLTSTCLVFVIFLGNHLFELEDHDYNRLEHSSFLALSRSAWTLAMCWIIWACVHGYGGVVNTFLSAHFFRVMGRITYSIFLIHMEWQYMENGSLKVPSYFSDYAGTEKFFGDILKSIIPAYLLTICVECPIVRLESMCLKKGSKKKISHEPT